MEPCAGLNSPKPINTITVRTDQVFTILNWGKPAMQGG